LNQVFWVSKLRQAWKITVSRK